MLYDMKYAGTVLRKCFEHNGEYLVVVVAVKIYQLCARFKVFELIQLAAYFVNVRGLRNFEAAIDIVKSQFSHYSDRPFIRQCRFRGTAVILTSQVYHTSV